MAGQYQFKPAHLTQSCDLATYEKIEKQIGDAFRELQVFANEVQRKIDAGSEDLNPRETFEGFYRLCLKVNQLSEQQRNLLKRVPQAEHKSSYDASVLLEMDSILIECGNKEPRMQTYVDYLRINDNPREVIQLVDLDEELNYYESEFEKRIQEYEDLSSDSSKTEWLLEKIADLDKLLSNIKAAYVKKQQLLPVDEKRKVGESMKKLTLELQHRVSTLRNLIEEHKKQQLRAKELSKIVGTSKLQEQSGKFKAPTLTAPSSVTSSKAERLEAERLKAKNRREYEIEQQQIEMERQMAQDLLSQEREQKRIDMEANLRKIRLEADADDRMRKIEVEQARQNGSRSKASIRSVHSELDMPVDKNENTKHWLQNVTPPDQTDQLNSNVIDTRATANEVTPTGIGFGVNQNTTALAGTRTVNNNFKGLFSSLNQPKTFIGVPSNSNVNNVHEKLSTFAGTHVNQAPKVSISSTASLS